MKQIVFPLKYRLIFWNLFPLSRLHSLTLKSLAVILIFSSLVNIVPALAQSASNVQVKVVANGQTILDRAINVPDGCAVAVDGVSRIVSGPAVVCALTASANSYLLTDQGSGIWLNAINGVLGKHGVCRAPNCWVYEVNNNLVSLGVENYDLKTGDSVLFKFGSQTPSNQPMNPPTQQPVSQPSQNSPNRNSPATPIIMPTSNTQRDMTPSQPTPKVLTPNVKEPSTSNSTPLVDTGGCSMRISWTAYRNQRPIFYGKWDGTYTVFVFPEGQTRDQNIWKKTTANTTVDITGLQNGVSYRGEVFVTGAFLSGVAPYWSSFGPVGCQKTQTIKPINQTTKPKIAVTKNPTTEISTSSVEEALNHLLAQQDSSGKIESVVVSGWSLMAFSSAGKNNQKLVNFLKNNSSYNKATDVERTILAAVAVGEDPRDFGGIDLLERLEGFANNGQIGEVDSLSDDIFGVLALVAVGGKGEIIGNSRDYIIAKQNSDGGWGFQIQQESDIDTTAAAIQALKAVEKTGFAVDETILNEAKRFLLSSQNSDGGFGFNNNDQKKSNTSSTAWATQALNSLGLNSDRAVNYLKSQQLSTGAFKTGSDGKANNLATAYSILALIKGTLPIRNDILGTTTLDELPQTGFEVSSLTIILVMIFAFSTLLILNNRRFIKPKNITFSYTDFANSINNRKTVRLRDH